MTIDDDVLAYLDYIAGIVASLQSSENWNEKVGDEVDEYKEALLELGRAYMYIYNLLLDEIE